MQEGKFELLVDGIPYIVKVTPFKFNPDYAIEKMS